MYGNSHLLPPSHATTEFKICTKKFANFYQPTTKDKAIPEDSHKRQLTTHQFITKDKGNFYNFTPSIGLCVWS